MSSTNDTNNTNNTNNANNMNNMNNTNNTSKTQNTWSSKAQRRKKRRRMSCVYLVLTVIFSVVIITTFVQLNQTERELDAHTAKLLQQKADLQSENEEYRQEVERLNTPAYMEQLARERLGLVRKGEIIVAPREE
ncbi:MAG: septum formation initiator family protein [Peptococcaceae bacterium]|nr:septum formation initiator family protein [Peptococcaceae bacterium]